MDMMDTFVKHICNAALNMFSAVGTCGEPFYVSDDEYVSEKFEIRAAVEDADLDDPNVDKESGLYRCFVWKGGNEEFIVEWYKYPFRGLEWNRPLSDYEADQLTCDLVVEVHRLLQEKSDENINNV